MTSIRFNEQKNRLEISFSGDTFPQVLGIMKAAFMHYDSTLKVWTGNIPKVASILEDIEHIDVLVMSPDAKAKLSEPQIPQEIEFVRHKLDTALML